MRFNEPMSQLCIVTALAAESRVFLDRWSLRAESCPPLRSFHSDRVCLLQTGIGKLQAASSVAAYLQLKTDIQTVINVGIAGADLELGSLVLAHTVRDGSDGACWYPHLPDHRKLSRYAGRPAGVGIHTLDQADNRYRKDVAFDMEAAGVFAAATRYLSTSQIQCIKIISDNPQHSLEALNRNTAKKTYQLLDRQFEQIESLIEALSTHGRDPRADTSVRVSRDMTQLRQQVHHTHNDTVLLKRLLEKAYSLGLENLTSYCRNCRSAQDIRRSLQERIDKAGFMYPMNSAN